MSRDEQLRRIKQLSDESILYRSAWIAEIGSKLADAADQLSAVFGSGHKVLLIGTGPLNGIAASVASAFINGQERGRHRAPLPALVLAADSYQAFPTSEESGSELSYERQLQAFGLRGDMLLVLSLNLRSAGVNRALQTAHAIGMLTMGIVGTGTSRPTGALDRLLALPHQQPDRAAEDILFLCHVMIDLIEHDLLQ